MDDRLAVGIGAAPAGHPVERRDGRRLGLQESPGDMIAGEELGERSSIPLLGSDISGEEIVAVHLDPPVDEDWDTGEDEKAAIDFAVEDRAGEVEAWGSGERRLRRHRIAGARWRME